MTMLSRSEDKYVSGHRKPFSLIFPALLLVAILGTAGSSLAADTPQKECSATDSFGAGQLTPLLNLGNIQPFRVFKNASYGTGGVALRNRGAGGISIGGVFAPVQAAYVYWAVIGPNKAASVITIKRLYPGVAGPANLPGVAVGAGPPPCPWPGSQIVVFRALIPPAIANGNGLYEVSLLGGAAGTVNGSDPWTTAITPLWDGASIVMVGQPSPVAPPGIVAIYDRVLSGKTFVSGAGLAYNLILPVPTPGARTLFDNVGADGKHTLGASRLAAPAMTSETTTIGGPALAGPGSAYWDSDWNGSSGLPVPELWDDTGHDITALGAGLLALPVTVAQPGGGDCLTPVVNVVEED